MSSFNFFCSQFAQHLNHSEWHFSTLLATAISEVAPLPHNADEFINQLLLEHPQKPHVGTLEISVRQSKLVRAWFEHASSSPGVRNIMLQHDEHSNAIEQNLPLLTSHGELANYLGLSEPELHWLADRWRDDEGRAAHLRHYHYHLIPKRSGGVRLIECPKSLLKAAQSKIYREIIAHMPVHSAAHGFRPKRNCLSHAQAHVGKRVVLKFDLADCFQSIGWPAVLALFRRMGYSGEVAVVLASLCTHRCSQSNPLLKSTLAQSTLRKLGQRHLPQGAPSSPALANAVLLHLDKRLHGLARRLDMRYSRYADDLAFSSDQDRDWQTFSALVGAICLEQGVALNHRKTKVMRQHTRQHITGVVVNNKPNVERRYYDNLKATLHNCRRDGLQSQNRDQHADFRAHLLGKVQHVKTLNPSKGQKLERLFDAIAD